MRPIELPHWLPPKFLSRFLTARGSLPKSFAGDAGNASSGNGTMDGGRDAAVPLAAIQVHQGARAPPACLIVQRSMPDRDPNAPLTHRLPIRTSLEPKSVSVRGRYSA